MKWQLNARASISWKKSLLIIFIVKALLFVWFNFAYKQIWPKEKIVRGLFVKSFEYGDYFEPIETLVDKGAYYNIDKNKNTRLYMNRMPGYLPVYGPLYFLFGKENAYGLIVLVQFMADVITVLFTCLIALLITQQALVFWITLIISSLSPFISTFVPQGYTESLSTFAFVTSLFIILYAKKREKENALLFLAGIFFCWSVFLRPAVGIFILLFPVLLFFTSGKSLKLTFQKIIYFNITFLLCISLWTYRNYKVSHKLVFLTNTGEIFADLQTRALFKLIITWGGDIQSWNPKSEMRWFLSPNNPRYDKELSVSDPFKNYIFTQQYTLQDLITLRTEYWQSYDSAQSNAARAMHAQNVEKLTERYIQSFKTEHTIHYYITAKLILLKDFLFVKQTYGLPFEKNTVFEKSIRLIFFAMYYSIVIGGIIGIGLSYLSKKREPIQLMLSLFVIIYISIHIKMGFIENRYLAVVYPLLIIFMASSMRYIFKQRSSS